MSENNEMQVVSGEMGEIMQSPELMHEMMAFAEVMASSRITVPQHLRGNMADCLAIVVQATQWKMNPFAISQKTFTTPGGKLGYEAQLVSAVLHNNAPLEKRLEYEFFGDWDKIIGKFQIKKSQKGNDYTAPDWKAEDEKGVGVKVIGKLRGEETPRVIDVLLMQCHPRNSTLWATDPQQQIIYAATQKWARRYFPDAILGVYSEVDSFDAEYRDMGAVERVDEPNEKPQQMQTGGTSKKTDALKDKVRAKNLAALIEKVKKAADGAALDKVLPEVRKAYRGFDDVGRARIDEAVQDAKARVAAAEKENEEPAEEGRTADGLPPATAEQLIKIAEGAQDEQALEEIEDMARELKSKADRERVSGAVESARTRLKS